MGNALATVTSHEQEQHQVQSFAVNPSESSISQTGDDACLDSGRADEEQRDARMLMQDDLITNEMRQVAKQPSAVMAVFEELSQRLQLLESMRQDSNLRLQESERLRVEAEQAKVRLEQELAIARPASNVNMNVEGLHSRLRTSLDFSQGRTIDTSFHHSEEFSSSQTRLAQVLTESVQMKKDVKTTQQKIDQIEAKLEMLEPLRETLTEVRSLVANLSIEVLQALGKQSARDWSFEGRSTLARPYSEDPQAAPRRASTAPTQADEIRVRVVDESHVKWHVTQGYGGIIDLKKVPAIKIKLSGTIQDLLSQLYGKNSYHTVSLCRLEERSDGALRVSTPWHSPQYEDLAVPIELFLSRQIEQAVETIDDAPVVNLWRGYRVTQGQQKPLFVKAYNPWEGTVVHRYLQVEDRDPVHTVLGILRSSVGLQSLLGTDLLVWVENGSNANPTWTELRLDWTSIKTVGELGLRYGELLVVQKNPDRLPRNRKLLTAPQWFKQRK